MWSRRSGFIDAMASPNKSSSFSLSLADFVDGEWVQVVLLLVVFALLLLVLSWFSKFLDKKIPTIDIKSGLLKNVLEAPKWALVAGLTFVLIGILILNTELSESSIFFKLLGVGLTELGFAFFIAFFLHISIEMQSRAEHDRQISRGVLSYIYGVNLDDQMFHATEEHVFRSNFFRRDLRVQYDLQSVHDGKILMKHSVEYWVENIGNSDDIFDIRTFVEVPTDNCGNTVTNRKNLGLHRIAIDGVSLTNEQIECARVDQNGDDPNYIISNHQLPLRAGEKAHVTSVSFVEKCERDNELWRSIFPASGLFVRITWPEDMNINMNGDVVHPNNSFDSEPHCEPGLFEAKLSKPLFPHNGFFLWWGPKIVPQKNED